MEYYGQYGQDVIIYEFFRKKGIRDGIFIDVGALDGLRFSNTYLLEQNGWSGICIEAHPSYIEILKSNRPNSECYSVAAGDENKMTTIRLNYRGSLTTLDFQKAAEWESETDGLGRYLGNSGKKEINGFKNGSHEIEMRTIDSIIEESTERKDRPINLISIDIDGSEKYAFKGLDLNRWKPDLLVLEHTIVGKDFLYEYAESFGYIFAKSRGSDTFFVHNETDKTIVKSINRPPDHGKVTPKHIAGREEGKNIPD